MARSCHEVVAAATRISARGADEKAATVGFVRGFRTRPVSARSGRTRAAVPLVFAVLRVRGSAGGRRSGRAGVYGLRRIHAVAPHRRLLASGPALRPNGHGHRMVEREDSQQDAARSTTTFPVDRPHHAPPSRCTRTCCPVIDSGRRNLTAADRPLCARARPAARPADCGGRSGHILGEEEWARALFRYVSPLAWVPTCTTSWLARRQRHQSV
jgi:hypothetical protein